VTDNPNGPLILMGMHRSGTTLLARSLSGLGVFLGSRRQRNEEAVLFRRYNDHLFALAGARWDHPGPARIWEENEGPGTVLAERLRQATSSYQAYAFLGPARYLKYKGLNRISQPWGWKDPRNTYLLDFWLRVFPHARVIHMTRHGVDVAASLRRRHEDRFRIYRRSSLKGIASLKSPPNPAASLRCATLQGGFTLWQEYLTQGRRVLDRLSLGDRAIEIRFEALAAEPEKSLRGIASFAGLDPDPGRLADLAREISPERSQAWRKDPELRTFAVEVQTSLEAQGYGT